MRRLVTQLKGILPKHGRREIVDGGWVGILWWDVARLVHQAHLHGQHEVLREHASVTRQLGDFKGQHPVRDGGGGVEGKNGAAFPGHVGGPGAKKTVSCSHHHLWRARFLLLLHLHV